jgi:hypothetical protein
MGFRPLRSLEYRLAHLWANARRKAYCRKLTANRLDKLNVTKTIPARVLSFSGKKHLPEQVASIRSFLTHAGCPTTFAVLSDGTYDAQDIDLLRQIHPSVEVISPDVVLERDLPAGIQRYAISGQALGLKLAALFVFSKDTPLIYSDSDVLFFPEANPLLLESLGQKSPALYTPDSAIALDARLLRENDEKLQPVNSGFMLLKEQMDWSVGISRLESLAQSTTRFTEQTVVHLVMHHNKARRLDPDKFVTQTTDQLNIRDQFVSPAVAMRHYVSTIRNKFWLRAMI